MIVYLLGYFFMCIIFIFCRFFYHLISNKNIISAVKNDFINVFDYSKQIIVSNPIKIKIIAIIAIFLIVMSFSPISYQNFVILDDFLSTIIYFVAVIIFLPNKNFKKFPVEIFGFIYSIMLMYGGAGEFLVAIFLDYDFFGENIWIYGYIIVLTSYFICIATLSKFFEHDLNRIEIIFIGMIMMIILEFMTYYGIGFFSAIQVYDIKNFNFDILEWVATVINHGIFIASQSQILERETREILGYIILNGTDALTITAVLGYLLQKIMSSNN